MSHLCSHYSYTKCIIQAAEEAEAEAERKQAEDKKLAEVRLQKLRAHEYRFSIENIKRFKSGLAPEVLPYIS